MKTYKVLGLMLYYPQSELIKCDAEMTEILKQEKKLPKWSLEALEKYVETQQEKTLLQRQEEYVNTFDRGRAHCLNLFEHVHGESRDRGQAMVNLLETYAEKKLYLNSKELPDYLPTFLEFLSLCSQQEANDYLNDITPILAVIHKKLDQKNSNFSVVFQAILALGKTKFDDKTIEKALQNSPQDPQNLEELDQLWEEAPAFGGDPMTDCNTCAPQNNRVASIKLSDIK